MELRRLETNLVKYLIVMYKSKYLKFIFQFVNYQQQQQRNKEAKNIIIAVLKIFKNYIQIKNLLIVKMPNMLRKLFQL